jgi:hypothetical protein
MVLVTTPSMVVTVATGQVTVVAVSTMVVTPPKVWVPEGTWVVVPTQTVVVSLSVTVVAGRPRCTPGAPKSTSYATRAATRERIAGGTGGERTVPPYDSQVHDLQQFAELLRRELPGLPRLQVAEPYRAEPGA